ncbi:hypothetical protein MSBR3_0863 [Methanosarcina barkeri 3]|uniref:HNH nuclease domain-containing protein n=1 Tax=Methanosarcina barkeri 3 TaxID=1434107 RepID=A0A0E3SIY2_METBA|nr:HNH endonuclease [Methanosarcina barkeri]AKB81441.1 hypothetical protein MSBR3_0863 [Methanosarcina barkeri 3]
MNDFRNVQPQRRPSPRHVSKYRLYKEDLRQDFKKCCGYCGDEECWGGGKRVFHIDHFVPRKILVNISEESYNNLVYSCFYCNNKKRADWPTGNENVHNDGIKGYIDPCDPTYGQQFMRNDLGEIIPLTPLGNYMYSRLGLSLRRHPLIWNLCRLEKRIVKLKELHKIGKLNENTKEFLEVLIEYTEYIEELKNEQSK